MWSGRFEKLGFYHWESTLLSRHAWVASGLKSLTGNAKAAGGTPPPHGKTPRGVSILRGQKPAEPEPEA